MLPSQWYRAVGNKLLIVVEFILMVSIIVGSALLVVSFISWDWNAINMGTWENYERVGLLFYTVLLLYAYYKQR